MNLLTWLMLPLAPDALERHVHQADPPMNGDVLVADVREEFLELACLFNRVRPVPNPDGALRAPSAFNPEARLSDGEWQSPKHLLNMVCKSVKIFIAEESIPKIWNF